MELEILLKVLDYSEEDLNWLNGVYTLDIPTDNTFQNGEWKLHMISFYDLDGNYLQVGGIGYFTGDEAGGRWLAKRAIRQAFDSLYRFHKPTHYL